MQLHTLTVHQLSQLLADKEVSSLELTQAYLERIRQKDHELQAFVTVTGEEALAQARLVDEQRLGGEELSALAGIPMAVQDNICTAGVKTTCASRMLSHYIPPADATVMGRLKKAGSVLIGKANLDEFGMGSSTGHSACHDTRNPFDLRAVPGGSGGGAAAAVAAGEAAFALGSDTGGDIRQPAAFCGVIGLKPTYGRVPRTGLISYASSLDQIGPFARDLKDLALILKTICGHDAGDSTSVLLEVPDFRESLSNDIKGLKIGLPKEYFAAGVSPGVAARLQEAITKLEELGARCVEVTLPHTEVAAAAHYALACAEASSNLARYDGVRYGLRVEGEDVLSMFMKTRGQGFGTAVKQSIMLGTYVLSTAHYEEYYTQALKIRTLNKQDFAQVFEQVDCLLTPVRSNRCTLPANLAGLPAISLPYGLSEGMPVGLQLIARHFDETTLLTVGYTLEQTTDQTRPQPNLTHQ